MPASPEVVAELNHDSNNPRNSEGAFVVLNDGRILFAYSRYSGSSWADHAPAVIAGMISEDQGRTWFHCAQPLVENEGGMNVMSVSLLRLQSGRIALFYGRKNSLLDCQLMMRLSEDEGKTWRAVAQCTCAQGYHVVNNDRVIQLADGGLLVPATLHRTLLDGNGQPVDLDYRGLNTFFRSDDEGKTWRSAGAWWVTPTGVSQECGVVELNDHSLYSWCRTDLGCQWCARSKDGAATWSVPEPTCFRSPTSPMSMKRIMATGDLVAIWNDHDPQWGEPAKNWDSPSWGRTPLAIALSRDDGLNWSAARLLETDKNRGFCYIAIYPQADSLLLAYCCGANREVLIDTKILRVPFEWLYQE